MRNPTGETPTNRGERVKLCPNEIRANMYDPSFLPSFIPSLLPFLRLLLRPWVEHRRCGTRSSPCVTPVDPGERIKGYMDKPKISKDRKFAEMLWQKRLV